MSLSATYVLPLFHENYPIKMLQDSHAHQNETLILSISYIWDVLTENFAMNYMCCFAIYQLYHS